MLSNEDAKIILHGGFLSPREQLCVILTIDPVQPLAIQEIRTRCAEVGLHQLAKTNISDTLAKSKGAAARIGSKWEIQAFGLSSVRDLAKNSQINLVVTHSSKSLRGHADLVSDPLTHSFVLEAIQCFEAKQYRAAVVFSWAGAIALLQNVVFAEKLDNFNVEASKKQHLKWNPAKQRDDLGKMKEYDFLELCEALGMFGKTVKQVLQNECLVLRNGCGHPNHLSIAENSVAAHIEKLIKNVFSKFATN
jgi:hypothetical protein